ncbi:hypothetical protein [Butyrivibrio proteoclasticus]|uniref:hypothetical protein n=1 Tax=Butyrivibrio proteoclasticus TaxID=43305 RepID=UPI0005565AB7|nr:hypothetical protein [Butyrivibrio proteoclasticus]
MKKRFIALLLATAVIASGCGAASDSAEKDVEISKSDEKSEKESDEESEKESDEESEKELEKESDEGSDKESDEDSKDASNGATMLEGRYTNGSIILTFSGNEFKWSNTGAEFTVNFELQDNEIVYDVDTLELTDACIAFYEEYAKDHFSDSIDRRLENLKKSYEEPDKIKFDENNKTLVYQYKTFYYVGDYSIGPNGTYTCEDDNATITFENGKVTFDNNGNKESFEYVCFEEKGKVRIAIESVGFNESEFYKTYNSGSFEYGDTDEIVLQHGTFKK